MDKKNMRVYEAPAFAELEMDAEICMQVTSAKPGYSDDKDPYEDFNSSEGEGDGWNWDD